MTHSLPIIQLPKVESSQIDNQVTKNKVLVRASHFSAADNYSDLLVAA